MKTTIGNSDVVAAAAAHLLIPLPWQSNERLNLVNDKSIMFSEIARQSTTVIIN